MLDRPALSPRAARTRAALVGAGFDLLAAKPIDAIPIDEVVATAGVAKGSFFNHFADKQAFALALATEVRLDLEAQVSLANLGVEDPLERIARGLVVGARFARANPKRTTVLLRSADGVVDREHPLNKGVADDFDAAAQQGLIGSEAQASGVLFWLGLCQALMAYVAEPDRGAGAAEARIREMLVLGLTGLGVDRHRVRSLVERATAAA